MRTPVRLNRVEQQLQTRARIIEAAANVFARRGLAGGSLDEVAAAAGYTKGAVYSNFVGKDDLFLAVLETRFQQRLDEIDDAVNAAASPSDGLEAVSRVCAAVDGDPEWCLLFMEFWTHAARDPELRDALAARYEAVRTRIADVIERKAKDFGIALPGPAADLAAAALALADGFALQRLAAPCSTDDNIRYATLLGRLFGLESLRRDCA